MLSNVLIRYVSDAKPIRCQYEARALEVSKKAQFAKKASCFVPSSYMIFGINMQI